ncbi:MAG: hypothetical protein QF876_10350 [Desulfobacterales bacterium]|nr:hypothetical protein [Desulfobacterales bacterium]MDP6808222.1 hypothetical protein [Desulfobacterales bacterium]
MYTSSIMPLEERNSYHRSLVAVAEDLIKAREKNASVILMMGAHVLRSGVQRYIIDLMKRGLISCIASNGACVIHDYELAKVGGTTESVAKYIKTGHFGFWKETGEINEIINDGAGLELGLGESVGKALTEGEFPFNDISLFAAGHRLKIPMTVHVGIGYDITHQHPNCNGAAYGATSYRDFLRFANIVENLEDGVVLNFGSAVMAPEVLLKALSMARNLASQRGDHIRRFTILVCDLLALPDDFSHEAPKDNHTYYFRPWKTMLVRTVADGGSGYYVQGLHRDTIPALWTSINKCEYC